MSKIRRGFRNVSYLSIGMFVKTLIGFFGIVYIARLLGPNYYGVYVTASTFVGLFTVFGLFGIHKVVIRKASKDLNSMKDVLEDTVGIKNAALIIAIVACCVAALFTNYETRTKIYIFIFTFSIWARGLEGFIGTIYKANEKMKYLAIFNIIETTIFVTFGIFFIKMGYGVFSLVIISSFTPVFTLLLRYFYSKRFVRFDFNIKPHFDLKILKPALIFSFISFLNLLSTRIDILMISFLDTSAAVGIYAVAYKVVSQSLNLNHIVMVAFFPIAVKIFHKGNIQKRTISKYSFILSILFLLIAVAGHFFATDIVILLYGIEYEQSGHILSILLFYLVFWWSSLPFTTAIEATKNEKVILVGMSMMATMNIPLNYILWHRFGLIGIAYSTLIVWSLGSMFLNVYSYKILSKQGYLI